MCYFWCGFSMLWLLVIELSNFIINGVSTEKCPTHNKENTKEIKCHTEWSSWTTCYSPYSSMDDAITMYKDEIRENGCREPLAYWAATVNSRMMKHRKTLPAYREKMGYPKKPKRVRIVQNKDQTIMRDVKSWNDSQLRNISEEADRLLKAARKKKFENLLQMKTKLIQQCKKHLAHGKGKMPNEFFELSQEMGLHTELVHDDSPISKLEKKPDIGEWYNSTLGTQDDILTLKEHDLWRYKEDMNLTISGLLANSSGYNLNTEDIQRVKNILEEYKQITLRKVAIIMDIGIAMVTNRSDMMNSTPSNQDIMDELQKLAEKELTLAKELETVEPRSILNTMVPSMPMCHHSELSKPESSKQMHMSQAASMCDQLFELMIMELEVKTDSKYMELNLSSSTISFNTTSVVEEKPLDNETFYNSTDEYGYKIIEDLDVPSIGCGFCPRRIRCCKDNVYSWIDQHAESEPCEEFSSPCEVPPLSDGTCNFQKFMPKFQSERTSGPNNMKNKALVEKIENKLRLKWMQFLGSLEPSMNCQKKDGLCYCCCGNNMVFEDRWTNMVCRHTKHAETSSNDQETGSTRDSNHHDFVEGTSENNLDVTDSNFGQTAKPEAESQRHYAKPQLNVVKNVAINSPTEYEKPAKSSIVHVQQATSKPEIVDGKSDFEPKPKQVLRRIRIAKPSLACQEMIQPRSHDCSPSGGCNYTVSFIPILPEMPRILPRILTKQNIMIDIIFRIPENTTRFWTGVGFARDPQEPVDVVIVKVTPQNTTVVDGYLKDYPVLEINGSQNVLLTRTEKNGDYISLTIWKSCKENDQSSINICKDNFHLWYPVYGGALTSDNQIAEHFQTPEFSKELITFMPCFDQRIPQPPPDAIFPQCKSGNWTEFSNCSPVTNPEAASSFFIELETMGCKVVPPTEIHRAGNVLREKWLDPKRNKRQAESQLPHGCGFCSARIRCCNGSDTWVDQALDVKLCLEHKVPCKYPLHKGGCSELEQLMLDAYDVANEVPGNLEYKLKVAGRLMQDNFGERRLPHNCLSYDKQCHCCCGEYHPVVEKTTKTVTCKIEKKKPKKIEKNDDRCAETEAYRECSNGCEPTCDEPNPMCIAVCLKKNRGCYCKNGYVRYGKQCIMEKDCPKFVQPIYPICSGNNSFSEWSECIPTGSDGELDMTSDLMEQLSELNCSVVTPVSVQTYFSSIPGETMPKRKKREVVGGEKYCGYCSTRLRCCKDTLDWHLQATEKEVCIGEEFSKPCENREHS